MGLHLNIYRAKGYQQCSNGGLSSLFDTVTVVNVPGPFEPDASAPAVQLESHVAGCLRLVPVEPGDGAGPMFGGAYASTSDSRFSDACEELLGHRFYGAVPLHDRFEKQRMPGHD